MKKMAVDSYGKDKVLPSCLTQDVQPFQINNSISGVTTASPSLKPVTQRSDRAHLFGSQCFVLREGHLRCSYRAVNSVRSYSESNDVY